MSTIKVNKIENTSTTNGGVSIDTDGHVTIDGQQLPTAGPLSNRNLIINGAMQFAERSISANNITSTDAYLTVDRYRQFINTLGTWTVERHASGPPGFDYSYRATCTSGNASPAAGSYAFIRYGVEKQDMQRLAWVTTGAKEFTLSFWVKSNRTGTASLTILYSDGNLRGMTKTYTIDALNTWEHKSLTFPANGLSESSDGDNGVGFWIEWWLGSGSSFTGGSANTNWATLNDNQRNPTNFGLGSVSDQEFHLTGVQLEVGSKSTPFEHRSYGDELARCQRYYQKIGFNTNASLCMGFATQVAVYGTLTFVNEMRVAPSVISTDPSYYSVTTTGVSQVCNGFAVDGGSKTSARVRFIHPSNAGFLSKGAALAFLTDGRGGLIFDAEL
jgi:hypothetical protein